MRHIDERGRVQRGAVLHDFVNSNALQDFEIVSNAALSLAAIKKDTWDDVSNLRVATLVYYTHMHVLVRNVTYVCMCMRIVSCRDDEGHVHLMYMFVSHVYMHLMYMFV
jgi:hypothetical protein